MSGRTNIVGTVMTWPANVVGCNNSSNRAVISRKPPRHRCQMGKHCLKGDGKSGRGSCSRPNRHSYNCLLFFSLQIHTIWRSIMCLPFSKSEHSKRGSVAPSSSSYLDNKRRNSTGAGITTHHHHNHHRRHFPLSSLHSQQQQQQQQRRATSCSRRVLQQPLPTRPNMATAAFLDPTPPPSDQHHFPSSSSSSQQRKQHHHQHHQHHVLPPTPPKEKSTAPSSSSSSPPRDHCASANPKSIGNYVLQQNLGKGSMGKVKLGVHNVTGEKVGTKDTQTNRGIHGND